MFLKPSDYADSIVTTNSKDEVGGSAVQPKVTSAPQKSLLPLPLNGIRPKTPVQVPSLLARRCVWGAILVTGLYLEPHSPSRTHKIYLKISVTPPAKRRRMHVAEDHDVDTSGQYLVCYGFSLSLSTGLSRIHQARYKIEKTQQSNPQHSTLNTHEHGQHLQIITGVNYGV